MSEVIRVNTSRCDVVDSCGLPGEPPELLPLPISASLGVRIRDAAASDVPFIDALQKTHNKGVGWMPTAQLKGHIAKGHVIVAEGENGERVGYCIGVDKYFKREDTGIIYQMNITPGRQRGLVGATLLKAMFDRCPYGVKLFCCWCAQDLKANHFWEAMGFVPLAFRAGSRRNGRVHIFWQKRIRQDDTETEWWYPSQTGSGAIREDRIVLPIPPGTHWSDAKPTILPGVASLIEEAVAERKALEGSIDKETRAQRHKAKKAASPQRPADKCAGGLWFGRQEASPADTQSVEDTKPKRTRKAPVKNDPRLVAAARELRDRWMEKVATEPELIALGNEAKYNVSRQINSDAAMLGKALPETGQILEGMTDQRHRLAS